MRTLVGCLAACFLLAGSVSALWSCIKLPRTPRTADGKPNLTAATPRNADGKPDLSGIWKRVDASKHDKAGEDNFNLLDWMPASARILMKPEAAALYDHRRNVLKGGGRPSQECLPHSIPDSMLPPVIFKIVQIPDETIILFEEFNHFRQIFTDGRALPVDPQEPAWWGYSVGRWDANAFVVTTSGFNDRSWLDDTGHPHGEALRTTERFRRIDFGHMEMQVTIDDPQMYLAPFTATVRFDLQPDTELLENICENEKDSEHIVGK
jgi:hypothetical protein